MGSNRFLVGQGFPKEYFPVDPYNYRETADESFAELMYERATKRIRPFEGMSLLTSYAALYDVTPDWYPFVGPRRNLSGYFDACGGSGHGFKIGPAIGKELAAWVHTGSAAKDFSQLSHDRLADNYKFVGAYGGNRG
jgi:glycine/D-amino acid oxidase-like deaminating enzyme